MDFGRKCPFVVFSPKLATLECVCNYPERFIHAREHQQKKIVLFGVHSAADYTPSVRDKLIMNALKTSPGGLSQQVGSRVRVFPEGGERWLKQALL